MKRAHKLRVMNLQMTSLSQTMKLKAIILAISSKCKSSNATDLQSITVSMCIVCELYSEIIDNRYIILRKLGWGHFSVVWLALKLQDKKLYALKIQKSADKYTESALEEEEILFDVANNYQNREWVESVRKYMGDPNLVVTGTHTHNLQMYDQFMHHSMNGKHSVMAFEVLGRNLLTLIKRFNYDGIPMPVVREITKQMLMGLDYLHRMCNIIHTDLKPENVVFEIE